MEVLVWWLRTAVKKRNVGAGLVFDWLYPAHFTTILACLGAWADTPEVSTPILKFVAEFVMNKTQRLAFDASSASGILLFREVSKVCRHLTHVLSAPSQG